MRVSYVDWREKSREREREKEGGGGRESRYFSKRRISETTFFFLSFDIQFCLKGLSIKCVSLFSIFCNLFVILMFIYQNTIAF